MRRPLEIIWALIIAGLLSFLMIKMDYSPAKSNSKSGCTIEFDASRRSIEHLQDAIDELANTECKIVINPIIRPNEDIHNIPR